MLTFQHSLSLAKIPPIHIDVIFNVGTLIKKDFKRTFKKCSSNTKKLLLKKNLDITLVKSWYKPRILDSHKGTYGHGFLMAGSKGMMGAAVISSRACLRSGIGLLTTMVPASERNIVQQSIPEAMLAFKTPTIKELNKYSAVAIGPGIGTDRQAALALEQLINAAPQRLLLDADALNILSKNTKLLSRLPAHTILTPHIKEFDRIFGTYPSLDARIESAIAVAKQLNIIIVLKNAVTIITDGEDTIYNEQPNAGLAKGGSGDMLTGILLAMLSQGYDPIKAAALAVFIHSKAAGISLQDQSEESLLATDVIEKIGAAFKFISNY